MSEAFVSSESLPRFALWDKLKKRRAPISFDLEVTARCNNDCRHCYINLPASDAAARSKELSLDEIGRIAEEAISLGAVWCLMTGGEPLLRADFCDLYMVLKRRGLLVSLFTNACLVTDKHVALFKAHPPRDLEVTVYGVTEETYERVTRRRGSFAAFRRGLDLLLEGGIPVRLKAMALRSNVHELPAIADFARSHTKDFFRFDPLLHLRFDRDSRRNEEIRGERLSPEEIVAIERADQERFETLKKRCAELASRELAHSNCDHLFRCGAGQNSFAVSYDGLFRLCSSLWHPDSLFDLRNGTLREAWQKLVPTVRDIRCSDEEFLRGCRVCPLINLCLWCPAHAYLETGEMTRRVDQFCQVAHARARALGSYSNPSLEIPYHR